MFAEKNCDMLDNIDNHIYAYGAIGGAYRGAEFSRTLREAERYGDPVIHLHTPGGDVLEGNLMVNAIRSSHRPVTVEVEGFAASMGAIIMLAASRVKAASNSLIMLHAPSSWMDGNAKQLEQQAGVLKQIESTFKEALKARGITDQATLDGYFDGEDHWFTAQEALEAHLIDEVITPAAAAATSKPANYSSAAIMDMRFSAILEHCDKSLKISMIEKLKKLLGMSDTSTEQEVMDKISTLQTMALERDNLLSEQRTTLIEAAIADGRIDATLRDHFANIGKSMGTAALKTTLEAMPKRQSAMSYVRSASTRESLPVAVSTKKFDDYTSEELARMRAEDRERYDALLEEKYAEK